MRLSTRTFIYQKFTIIYIIHLPSSTYQMFRIIEISSES